MDHPDNLKNIKDLIAAAEKLLEWMPKCSKGSSGDLRRQRLEDIISLVRNELSIFDRKE